MCRFLVFAALALGLLAACASTDPTLYTLATVPGATGHGGVAGLVVRQVSVARYLERDQIVRSSSGYKLDVASNDWWAEPLGAMVTRVLAADLAARLPGTQVLAENGAIAANAALRLEVNLQRFDADGGNFVLEAQIAIVRPTGTPSPRTVRIVEPITEASITGEVAAASRTLGRLGDAVAAGL